MPTPTTPPPAPPPPAPEPPGVPAGFQASASGEDFIEWSWTAVEGADAYDVQLSLDAEFDGSDPIAAVSGTSFRNPLPLPAETTAHARVRSAAGEGSDRLTSGWSDPVSGMTTAPAVTKPAIPAGLRVSNHGEDFIEWSWSEVPGAHGYKVEHSRNEQFTDSTTADVEADTHSYRVEDLPSDTNVYLRVRSFVGTGDARLESDWSIHRTGMTELPAAMAPDTPTINPRVDRGEDYIEWSWNAVSGADGYEVQFSLDGQFGGSTTVDRTADQRSYRKEDLDPETRGYLRVRAFVVDDGERLHSMWSEAATAVTEASSLVRPVAPQNVRVTDKGPTFIEWRWEPVPEVSGYDVLYSDNAQLTTEDEIEEGLSPEVVSYRKDGLLPDTEHWLQVRAYVSDGTRRLVSPWTPDNGRPGRTELAVPAGLKVDDARTDHRSIGWQWNEVAGANSYEYQFSLETPIPDDSDIQPANSTSVVIGNLNALTKGYLRVRSVVGTGTSARRSKWSEPATGTTKAAPAPTVRPLSAPDVTAGSPTNDTIRLTWSPVEGAAQYLVEQRPANTTTWDAARCGTDGDQIVTNAPCVASGLEQGTDYQFRVQARPDPGDNTRSISGWSVTRTARTRGEQVPAGGEAAPNITWRSTENSITWSWAPAADRRIEYQVALLRDPRDSTDPAATDATLKCPALTTTPLTGSFGAADTTINGWFAKEPTFAKTLGTTISPLAAGQVWGLCVVSTWDTDTGRQYGEFSLAWATTSPEEATVPAPGVPNGPKDSNKRDTTAIDWYFVLDSGFEYEVGTVSVSVDDAPSELSCSSVSAVTPLKGTGDTRHRLTNLADYTQYAACVRAKSGSSSSGWAMLTPYWTLPGTGPTPTYSTQENLPLSSPPAAPASNSEPWTRTDIDDIVWSFSGGTSLPEDPGNYQVRILGWTGTARTGSRPAPACDVADGGNYVIATSSGANSIIATGSGFENAGLDLDGLAAVDATASTITSTGSYGSVYLWACVRAELRTTPAGRATGRASGRTDFYGPWSAVGSKILRLGTRPLLTQ